MHMAQTGRPPKYETPQQMQEAIDEYFADTQDEKLTLTGLALALGFASRQSIYDYERDETFSYTIKRARLRIENSYEMALRRYGRGGDVFALKNFGWKDAQELNHTGADGVPLSLRVEFVNRSDT